VLLDLMLELRERAVTLHHGRGRAELTLQLCQTIGTFEQLGIGGLREQLLDARDHPVQLLLDARTQAVHAPPRGP
jgi:hypothetical protein